MKVHNRKIQGSLQIIIKTARALNQILPWTIAIFTGGQLIVSLQPYLTVFLSARVVDLLSVHAKMEQVIALIVLSGAGTYTLIFLGKYFDSKRNVRGLDLYWAILWRMNRVLMKCPYSEVEKTKLRTQQEEIIQAYRMSGYGPWKIPEIMMELISGCVMIVMSIVMGGVVFLPVQGERVPWATVVMLALTIVSVIVSVVSQRQLLLLNQQSIGDMGKIFMKENYLLSYMDEQKAAKDIRIYQQQNEIIGQLASAFGVFHTFIFQRGKKEARNLALRSCFAQLLTVASYVIVCIRAVNGVYSMSRGDENGDALVGVVLGWEETDKFGPTLHDQYVPCGPFADDVDDLGTDEPRWTYDYSGLNMSSNRICMSANCANPEAAMKFMNEFYDSEVSVEVLFGGISDGCLEKTGDDSYKVLDPLDPDTDSGTWKWTSSMADNGPMYIRRATTIDMAQDMTYALEEREQYKEAIARIDMDKEYYPQMLMKYTSEDQNNMAVTQANVSNVTEAYWGLWLTGESNIEDDWDSYVEEVNAAGLQDILAIRQASYDSWKAQ